MKIIISQAQECADALEKEIQILKAALEDETKLSSEKVEAVNQMIASEFTPPDKCFTVSALLGRLREPMDTPLPFNTTIVRLEPPAKKKRTNTPTPHEQQSKLYKSLLELNESEEYRREHKDSASLLALWKRISSHRTAAVFRKAVNPKEAPGYTERIRFPIDLGLIRKMITARIIVSFADLHQRIGLISHNCVKFNGRQEFNRCSNGNRSLTMYSNKNSSLLYRESDYAVVTREFEQYVDELFVATVQEAEKQRGKTTPDESAPTQASDS